MWTMCRSLHLSATDNHALSRHSFSLAGCSSRCPANSVKSLKSFSINCNNRLFILQIFVRKNVHC